MVKRKNNKIWKKIFAIAVLLLILGVVIAVVLMNVGNADILNKVP
jgi:uncharacterized protein YpmS